jgi:hypothetical protein
MSVRVLNRTTKVVVMMTALWHRASECGAASTRNLLGFVAISTILVTTNGNFIG